MHCSFVLTSLSEAANVLSLMSFHSISIISLSTHYIYLFLISSESISHYRALIYTFSRVLFLAGRETQESETSTLSQQL